MRKTMSSVELQSTRKNLARRRFQPTFIWPSAIWPPLIGTTWTSDPTRPTVQPPRPDRVDCSAVGRGNDRASAQTPSHSSHKSHKHSKSQCDSEGRLAAVPQPRRCIGIHCCANFSPPCRNLVELRGRAATVPVGYRRRTSQFGQVTSNARVWFSVKVIRCLAPEFHPATLF
jgi:hypothetical protein